MFSNQLHLIALIYKHKVQTLQNADALGFILIAKHENIPDSLRFRCSIPTYDDVGEDEVLLEMQLADMMSKTFSESSQNRNRRKKMQQQLRRRYFADSTCALVASSSGFAEKHDFGAISKLIKAIRLFLSIDFHAS